MHRAEEAALAGAVAFAPVLGAGLAGWGLDLAGVQGADARFVGVGVGALAPLWIGRLFRPGSRRVSRVAVALLGVPLLGLLGGALGPGLESAVMVPFVSWLSGGLLFLGLDAALYAGWTASRLGSGPARVAYAAVGGLPPLYFWAAAAVVVVNTQLLLAPVRLAHQAPPERPGERASTLETDDGLTLSVTETPAPPGAPAVVLLHGVADSRRRMGPWAARLEREGVRALRIDLRGHGRSDGSVVTYGQREVLDVLAAVRRLQASGAGPVHVVGTSMGGGVAMAAAPALAREGVRGVIAMAPTSSYPPLVAKRVAALGPLAGPVLRGSAVLASWMSQVPMTAWRPRDALRRTALPVLVLHGTADEIIDPSLSEALGDRVALHLLPGLGHVDIPERVAEDDATWALVRRFLDGPREPPR